MSRKYAGGNEMNEAAFERSLDLVFLRHALEIVNKYLDHEGSKLALGDSEEETPRVLLQAS